MSLPGDVPAPVPALGSASALSVPFSGPSPQQHHLTSFKICLALLIRDYAVMKAKEDGNSGVDTAMNVDEDERDEEEVAAMADDSVAKRHADELEGGGGGDEDEEEEKENIFIPAGLAAGSVMRAVDAPGAADGDALHPDADAMTPRQRRKLSVLLLKLVQGTDLSLQQLVAELLSPANDVSLSLLHSWRRHLLALLRQRVGGLMVLGTKMEKLVYQDFHGANPPPVGRTSVLGLYIRRFNVHFEALSFSDVSHLFFNLDQYVASSAGTLHRILRLVRAYQRPDEIPDVKPNEDAMDALASRGSAMGGLAEADNTIHSRRQAEFYIAWQVELLQNAECFADSSEEIERMTERILKSNPDLSQVVCPIFGQR